MTRILPSRPPVQKPAKAKRNPAHMARVAQLPCCICEAYGMAQLSPTQVHHVIHDRNGTKRAPDTATIPLCEGHHQGLIDTSKLALHRAPQQWRDTYGADHEWLDRLRQSAALP